MCPAVDYLYANCVASLTSRRIYIVHLKNIHFNAVSVEHMHQKRARQKWLTLSPILEFVFAFRAV